MLSHYSKILPHSRYSPWGCDKYFQKNFDILRNYTLVDEYRLFELYTLALQCCTLDGDFLEVGVFKGGSAGIIQSALNKLESNKKFYIADTFNGVVKTNPEKDNAYTGGEHAVSISYVQKLFSLLSFQPPNVLTGVFPDDHPNFNPQKLCFVHSDVDAYDSTKDIIEWCLPKLVVGGIIVFDDYGFEACQGVTEYVNTFMLSKSNLNQFRFIHNLNGHAILIKINK